MSPDGEVGGWLTPRPIGLDDGGVDHVRFALDAAVQPFLADHRVGGTPLLSTVMGIEAMAAAVLSVHPDGVVAIVEDVVVAPPVLLRDDIPVEIDVEIDGHGGTDEVGRERFACRVTSKSGIGATPRRAADDTATTDADATDADATGGSATHYSATVFVSDVLPDAPSPRSLPPLVDGDPVVEADAIYGLYFHGPAFRVVAHARWAGGLMIGWLNLALPPSARPEGPSAVAPLLVELCMQTAGLWELGSSGRMMIPAAVARITRYRTSDVYDGFALRALVSPRAGEKGPCSVFDADVVDDDGAVHMRVAGYATVPFSEPVDPVAAGPIIDALGGITRS